MQRVSTLYEHYYFANPHSSQTHVPQVEAVRHSGYYSHNPSSSSVQILYTVNTSTLGKARYVPDS